MDLNMSQLQQITGADFQTEVLGSKLPVVIDFYADWCAPCRMLGPILDRMSQQFAGRLKFVKINSDHEAAIANSFDVTGLPTLVFMEKGKVVGQFTGLPPEKELKDELTRWLDILD
jgi:thioredoxin